MNSYIVSLNRKFLFAMVVLFLDSWIVISFAKNTENGLEICNISDLKRINI